ncbi:hypothetical protein M434DRAFT_26521 [Hypoxylon sp. CO27-5]|nr:hypothetical protein M434DRAFT_26521 [Hypoxylon sp. CO27-5]
MPDPGIAYPSGLSQQQLRTHNRNPSNLSPLTFGALISLITTLIVGAALGGGLGAALGKKAAYETSAPVTTSASNLETQVSTPTSTTSSTISTTSSALFDYAAPTPSLVETLYIDCPKLDNTVMQDTASNVDRIQCARRIIGGGAVSTLSALTAYSLQDCIQACYLFNYWAIEWESETICLAVSWCKSMSYCSGTNSGANCWLFNASSSIEIEDNSTVAAVDGLSSKRLI